MSYTNMKVRYVDADLLSGSTTDYLRQTFGSYYEIISGSDGRKLKWTPCFEDITSVHEGIRYQPIKNTFNRNSGSTINAMKNITLPYSIMGTNIFDNSEQWKAYIEGSDYAGINYTQKINNNSIFEVSPLAHDLTYDLLYAKKLSIDTYGSYNTHEHTYDYNYYLKNYQKTRSTYLMYPNIYDLFNYVILGTSLIDLEKNIKEYLDPSGSFDQAIVGAVAAAVNRGRFLHGQNNKWLPLYEITDSSVITTMPAGTKRYRDLVEGARKYFYNFHDHEPAPTPENVSYVQNNTLVQILNSFNFSHINPSVENFKYLFPFYNIINIPKSTPHTDLHARIQDANFSDVLLREICHNFIFNDNAQTLSVASELKRDVVNSDGVLKGLTTTNQAQLRAVDLIDIVTKYCNYGKVELEDVHFLGKQTFNIKAAQDETGTYRYYNSTNADKLLGTLRNFIQDSNYWDTITDSTLSMCSSLAYAHAASAQGLSTQDPFAYRIIKTDIRNRETTDILIEAPNAPQGSVNYYDTQVEYGVPYQYVVYQYYIVESIKYKYRNLHLSRRIGELNFDSATESEECIEFYDYTSQDGYSPSPMTADPDGFKWDLNFWDRGGVTTHFGLDAFRYRLPDFTIAEYGTPAQEIIVNDYSTPNWADFIIDHELTYKIVESVHSSKTLTVLDHPAIPPDISVYQHNDDSQMIGFYISMESFLEKPYPKCLNTNEELVKSAYINSNNLLETENIPRETNEPRSRPSLVEIYRLPHKPSSIKDFDGHRVGVRDLKIKGGTKTDEYNTRTMICSSTFYDETITTNHKFYYVFRYMNENAIPGRWSNVYEVELIDDGGYKYIKTDAQPINSLKDDTEIVNDYPFTQFKNLFTLIPNIRNYDINDSAVDYEETADSQITHLTYGSGDSNVWNKTFKVRLTSKKTGKKVDLNVTYKLRDS